jgi:hypothetical protein
MLSRSLSHFHPTILCTFKQKLNIFSTNNILLDNRGMKMHIRAEIEKLLERFDRSVGKWRSDDKPAQDDHPDIKKFRELLSRMEALRVFSFLLTPSVIQDLQKKAKTVFENVFTILLARDTNPENPAFPFVSNRSPDTFFCVRGSSHNETKPIKI